MNTRRLLVIGLALIAAAAAGAQDALRLELRDPAVTLRLPARWKEYRITERRLAALGLSSAVSFVSVPLVGDDGSIEYVRLFAVARCGDPCAAAGIAVPGMDVRPVRPEGAGLYVVAWRRDESCPPPLRPFLADRDAVTASLSPAETDDGTPRRHTVGESFFFLFRVIFNR